MTNPIETPDTVPTALPASITPAAPPASLRWTEVVGKFAVAIASDVNTVTAALVANAVNAPDDAGLAILADPNAMDDASWAAVFTGVKRPVLRGAVAALRASAAPAPVALPLPPAPATTTSTGFGGASFRALIPIADDKAFLDGLSVGGRLNGTITTQDVVAAVRVGMAQSIGLYEVPERLVKMIEEYSSSMETPADGQVYDLLSELRERRYADILRPLGLSGSSVVSDARRTEFNRKLQETLWPGLRGFYTILKGWYENWQSQSSNPGMFANMMMAVMSGGGAGAMGMIQPPDVSVLQDACKELITQANRLFGGLYGVPVSRAMAYDALRIVGQLNDPRLAMAAGCASRDELLKRLRIGVTEGYARTERSVALFAQNAMAVKDISDPELPTFAGALYMVGNTINWDDLGTDRVSGLASALPAKPNGGRNARREAPSDFAPFPGSSALGSR